MTFLRLLWTVLGLCQRWRQPVMAGLKLHQAAEKIQRMTCKLDIVEDPFTPAAAAGARLSRSTFPSAFVRADTFLSYGLAEHGKGKPFLAPVLSGWEEATARNSHITFPVAGSCSVWTMSWCLRRRPSQCRDSEWNMVVVVVVGGGKRLPGSANSNVCVAVNGAIWTWPWCIVQTGKVNQCGDFCTPLCFF